MNLIIASLLSCVLLILSVTVTAQHTSSHVFDSTKDIKVTLLGTGNPQPWMNRFGPSIMIQAGNQTLLFDAGRGAMQRLWQLNVSFNTIDALFLTHLHSDHVVGLPDLWLTGWLVSKRPTPLPVFGPEGTEAMVKHLSEAFQFDIKMRIEDDKAPPEGSQFVAKDIKEDTVYRSGGVQVIAFEVDHQPIVPAFGYKIIYNGHSAVLSGDTRPSRNLIEYARGVDVLIHEVVIAPQNLPSSDLKFPVVAHHTTPEQAAQIFEEVKPKLAVYSHIVSVYGRKEEELWSRTKELYKDAVQIGEDLMTIFISEKVYTQNWQNK